MNTSSKFGRWAAAVLRAMTIAAADVTGAHVHVDRPDSGVQATVVRGTATGT